MNRILIIAEHDGVRLNPSTAKCVTCALAIPEAEVTIAVCAVDAAAVAAQAAALQGVSRVLKLENAANAHPLAAVLAPQLAALAAQFSHVLAPSTTFGKDLLPRVAALLNIPQISDVMAVESATRFRRPIYAGNVIVTVEVTAGEKLAATVRTASFSAAATGGNAVVEARAMDVPLPTHTRFVSVSKAQSERPDLQSATRVVSGGRAFGSAEAFSMLYALADRLGAAVGASRAAVDAGYAPNELQVGQTGKIIAPEIYFALGISGAIQHLTGIKDARTIVAINKDAEAPIFEVADIGLVGDIFQILPELEQLLAADGATAEGVPSATSQ
jgi:electron transfer flavoprotein alpha subunit